MPATFKERFDMRLSVFMHGKVDTITKFAPKRVP